MVFTLNEDEYFNMPLVDRVRETVKTMSSNDVWEGYTKSQMEQWLYEGDLVDAMEFYINLYKDNYGVKPRFLTEEQSRDLAWIRAATKELMQ